MSTFKVGDRVRITGLGFNCSSRQIGESFTVAEIHDNYAREHVGRSTGVEFKGLELVEPTVCEVCHPALPKLEIKFILQYELDSDPFETFATMEEIETRIKELAKCSDLKRESIKVYEIAKTYDVTLEQRVFFKLFGEKVTMKEKGAVPPPSTKARASRTLRGRTKGKTGQVRTQVVSKA